MACPSQPPCRFDTKVESQIQPGEKPADSVNPENALEVRIPGALDDPDYRAQDAAEQIEGAIVGGVDIDTNSSIIGRIDWMLSTIG
jgi:hypothetical protein